VGIFTIHHPQEKKRKKREAPSLHDATSHWLNGNSIPEIGCHYCWPGLIALHKNTLPIDQSATILDHYDNLHPKYSGKTNSLLQLDML
jgi:hypothetical protein